MDLMGPCSQWCNIETSGSVERIATKTILLVFFHSYEIYFFFKCTKKKKFIRIVLPIVPPIVYFFSEYVFESNRNTNSNTK